MFPIDLVVVESVTEYVQANLKRSNLLGLLLLAATKDLERLLFENNFFFLQGLDEAAYIGVRFSDSLVESTFFLSEFFFSGFSYIIL